MHYYYINLKHKKVRNGLDKPLNITTFIHEDKSILLREHQYIGWCPKCNITARFGKKKCEKCGGKYETTLDVKLEDCFAEIREIDKPYECRYKDGEFPSCFTPCPPFYDICNTADLVTSKCWNCFKKYNFVDYIE